MDDRTHVIDLLARVGADEPAAVLHGAVTSQTTAAPVFGADAERLDRTRRLVVDRLGAAGWAAAVGEAVGSATTRWSGTPVR